MLTTYCPNSVERKLRILRKVQDPLFEIILDQLRSKPLIKGLVNVALYALLTGFLCHALSESILSQESSTMEQNTRTLIFVRFAYSTADEDRVDEVGCIISSYYIETHNGKLKYFRCVSEVERSSYHLKLILFQASIKDTLLEQTLQNSAGRPFNSRKLP